MCRKALPKRYRTRSSVDSQASDIMEVRLVATVSALQDVITYEGAGQSLVNISNLSVWKDSLYTISHHKQETAWTAYHTPSGRLSSV